MRTSVKALCAAAVVLIAGSFCYGADKIDNPEYAKWSKFKAGTTVTMKTDSDFAGNKSSSETTTTLTSIDGDKAVVETKTSMEVGGKQMDMPASSRDIPAKIDKPPEVKPTDAPKAEVKESTEEVDAAGKKVTAKVTETKSSTNGIDTTSKVWMSDEIPGGMIKMESTMSGTMKGSTKMELTKMDIK